MTQGWQIIIECVSGLSKKIKKYLARAYQVYSGQKRCHVVAEITEDVAKRTGYSNRKNIIIKRAVVDHFSIHYIDSNTKLVDKNRLFRFVETLNIPDEIYQSKCGRLSFFRKICGVIENQVVVDKEQDTRTVSLVVTQFDNFLKNKKDIKYLKRQKNTTNQVFLRDSGRAGNFPSSDMLAQVPGAGSRLPRSSESSKSIKQKYSKVKTK